MSKKKKDEASSGEETSKAKPSSKCHFALPNATEYDRCYINAVFLAGAKAHGLEVEGVKEEDEEGNCLGSITYEEVVEHIEGQGCSCAQFEIAEDK